MWGCFWVSRSWTDVKNVFPTHVGVFPLVATFFFQGACFPHACGGVSYSARFKISYELIYIFPTSVGVFPLAATFFFQGACFPHASGGVSDEDDGISGLPVFSLRMWGCFPF